MAATSDRYREGSDAKPSAVPALVAHEALVADLDPNGIEKHQWVADIERPVLRVIIAAVAIAIGATAFAQEQLREDETRAINELSGR
jgi:hypothetical protein